MNSSNTFDSLSEDQVPETAAAGEPSFADILTQFEHEHDKTSEQAMQGTVVAVNEEAVIVDIGRKQEGAVPVATLRDAHGPIVFKVGDPISVTITGRDAEGYYTLSPFKVKRPFDWSGLEKAFQAKDTILGNVVEVVKGGLRVDVGARAFLPASRSGARDVADMEKLVGTEIPCRITKLDIAKEDVVVDRRVILEEQEAQRKAEAFAELAEGKVIHGRVRTITDFGAFIDLGGVDGLLHVSDISWNKVGKPSDVLSVGDSVEVKILKLDRPNRRISLGMKQLTPDPWTQALETFKQGDRVRGKVVRLADFGAFVELRPGVDGLIHLSEMSWSKKVRRPSDAVKTGDEVDVLILGVNPGEKRISLGLKQALGDPWEQAEKRFPIGSIVEGTVLNLAKFGAFVDLGDSIEGMIHVGDITNEKRLDHPKDMLQVGKLVRAIVLELDRERRRIRLGMKQLEPTAVDKWIADHQVGESLNGRVVSADHDILKVEVGEGVVGYYRIPKETKQPAAAPAAKPVNEKPKADLGSLTAMLASRWKEGMATETVAEVAAPKYRSGQVRMFKVTALDAQKKRIDVEPV